jgi:GntR family transcriptional regulator
VPTVDKNQPAFRRVWSDLRSQILAEQFPAGSPLPTEAEIARNYSVSRQTVRRAFQDLVAEGLVFRVRGKGTFATPVSSRYLRQFGSVDDLIALSADSQLQVALPLGPAVDPMAAGRLRLPDDLVATTTFVRLHRSEPFCHTCVYLPPWVHARLGEVTELATAGTISEITVLGLLDRALDAPIRDAEQSITVDTATPEVAGRLALPSDSPVLRTDRMYFDASGKPVELAISHFHPDRYSYRIRLRRSV